MVFEKRGFAQLGAGAIAVLLLIGVLLFFSAQESKAVVSAPTKLELDDGETYFLTTLLVNGQETINFEKGSYAVSKDGSSKFILKSKISVRTYPISAVYRASAIHAISTFDGHLFFQGLFPAEDSGLIPYQFASSGVQATYGVEVSVDGSVVERKNFAIGTQGVSSVVTNAPSSIALAENKVVLQNLAINSFTHSKPNLADVIVAFNINKNEWYSPISKADYSSKIITKIWSDGRVGHDCTGIFEFACYNRVHDLMNRNNAPEIGAPSDYANFVGEPQKSVKEWAWTLAPGDWQSMVSIAVSTKYADKVTITAGLAKPEIVSHQATQDLGYQKQGKICAVVKNIGQSGVVSVQFSATTSLIAPAQQDFFEGGKQKEFCTGVLGQLSEPSKSSSESYEVKACGVSQFKAASCVSAQGSYKVLASGGGGTGTNIGGGAENGGNETQCLPFLQYRTTTPQGGINLPFVGNVGGTPVASCAIDWGVIAIILTLIFGALIASGALDPADLGGKTLFIPLVLGVVSFIAVSQVFLIGSTLAPLIAVAVMVLSFLMISGSGKSTVQLVKALKK